MKTKLPLIIRTKPFYLFLLPVFFVWHGYVEFYDLIALHKAAVLVIYYLLSTGVVYFIAWIFFRNRSKASLFAFLIMCLYFFFGSMQDYLKAHFQDGFITKYSFILPVLLALFVLLFIFLKKFKNKLESTFSYLNLLLFILLLFDTALLIKKQVNKINILTAGNDTTFITCKDCPKPDIYLIITDGYSGKIPLQFFFNYDNSKFESQLKNRGFFIVDSSTANYNYTLFSIGSLLNLDYLNLSTNYYGKKDIPVGYKSIKNNSLLKYLQNEQYNIYNYSIFDLDGYPKHVKEILMNFEVSPITTQTFLYRLQRDIGYHLITDLKLNFLHKQEKKNHISNNKKLLSLTKEIAYLKSEKPKFIYTHLIMPHNPYYFDSLGKRVPDKLLTYNNDYNKNSYISYLKYTNTILLELTDHIQLNSARPPIIILMSDHGFRESDDINYLKNYQLMNLNAVFFPDKNYSGFYKGMSNVNQFRVILNAQFNQQLNLLKDSITLLKN